MDSASPFLKRQASPRVGHVIRIDDLKLGSLMSVVEIPERQVLPPAQAAMVGILEYPCLRAALRRVELTGLVEDFKKYVLHHIFCLAWVAQDSQRYLQNKPVKAIKENR